MPRPGPRTPHDNRRDQARRQQRTANRRIVPMHLRPLPDGIVDHVAIDLALRGWAEYAAKLREGELIAAVAEGIRRGMGTPEIADRLLLHDRQVERYRKRLRQQAREKELEPVAA